MALRKVEESQPCPHCGGTSVRKNGSSRGHARLHCRDCGKSFGATFGTPMYRLHTAPEEVARTLLIVMRRGSLRAAAEISGHKYETIGKWLRHAGEHTEALTRVLAKDLELDEVEVDAFWSFVGNASRALKRGQRWHRKWPNAWTVPAGGALASIGRAGS
jgi:transposase-like protein